MKNSLSLGIGVELRVQGLFLDSSLWFSRKSEPRSRACFRVSGLRFGVCGLWFVVYRGISLKKRHHPTTLPQAYA